MGQRFESGRSQGLPPEFLAIEGGLLLEVFNVARQSRPTARAHSVSLYRSGNGFGYAFGMDVAPEGMRLAKGELLEWML